MPTEIQKVPGKFNLPSDWPKLVLPDTTTDLYADFDATTLPLGALSGAWRTNGGSTPFALSSRTGAPVPTVSKDANGIQKVTFDGTNRLDGNPATFAAMPAQLTILATFRPTQWVNPDDAGNIRVVTGPGWAYRSIQMNGKTQGQYFVASGAGEARMASTVPVGQITQVAGRFGVSSTTANIYGIGTTVGAATGTVTSQAGFFIGANGEDAPAGHFKGDLYRVQIWGRVLNDTDIAAAMSQNAERFRIPNPAA